MAVKRKTGRPAKVPGEKGTKEKIFEAAIDLFAARGYDGVSIRDIAAAVGIKESSIYKHYANKEELLEKILEYPLEKIETTGPQDVGTEELIVTLGLERFMAMGSDLIIGWIDELRLEKIFRIVCVELYHNERVKAFYAMFMDVTLSFWTKIFSLMLKHELIRPANPEVLAREYISFYGNLFLDYFLVRYGRTEGTFRQVYRNHIDQHTAFLVNSIKP